MPPKKKIQKSSNFFESDFFADDADAQQDPQASFEKEVNDEVDEHMLNIREATKNTRKSLEQQWSTDYYFCAFFADQEQRDEFLRKAGALGLVKDNFINGQLLAEKLGIELTEKTIEAPRLFAPKRDWFDITM